MKRTNKNPHAELCDWANGLRPDSPQNEKDDARHTVGPWKLLKFEDDERYCVTNEAGSHGFHREIATVSFGYSEPAETEQHANARLIAAAPELLDALIDLGDWLAYGLNKAAGAEPTAEDHATCERVAAKARAAVDKATK